MTPEIDPDAVDAYQNGYKTRASQGTGPIGEPEPPEHTEREDAWRAGWMKAHTELRRMKAA